MKERERRADGAAALWQNERGREVVRLAREKNREWRADGAAACRVANDDGGDDGSRQAAARSVRISSPPSLCVKERVKPAIFIGGSSSAAAFRAPMQRSDAAAATSSTSA